MVEYLFNDILNILTYVIIIWRQGSNYAKKLSKQKVACDARSKK